ncbi:MAG: phosphatidylserine decarboxylase [Oleiphilaceae bacterium]|nr:phosphatidylserine decarboxylase [Oleiphilaceae bacterium]
MRDKLFILSQYLAPQLTVSRLAGKLANSERVPAVLKNRFVNWFIKRYGVDMSEAEDSDISHYPSFNAFFTRALKPGVRRILGGPDVVASPVDGAMSQLGQIRSDRVFQAKGQSFSLFELLGGDEARAAEFTEGEFATIYLAPKDYHRIHMPLAGTLREMVYVPGRLFSVNPLTAAHVPNLFARNERVVTIFDTDYGPMAMILVGAMIVGSVETVWAGVVAPGPRQVSTTRYHTLAKPLHFDKGEEMGRFRLGSTVILVFPKDVAKWDPAMDVARNLRLGEALGHCEHR